MRLDTELKHGNEFFDSSSCIRFLGFDIFSYRHHREGFNCFSIPLMAGFEDQSMCITPRLCAVRRHSSDGDYFAKKSGMPTKISPMLMKSHGSHFPITRLCAEDVSGRWHRHICFRTSQSLNLRMDFDNSCAMDDQPLKLYQNCKVSNLFLSSCSA